MKGDSWESAIFKLGDASTTSDIPHAPEVTRKTHNVTQGGIRGPQNIRNTNSMTNQPHNPAAQATGSTNGSASNGSTSYGTSGFSNQVEQSFSKEGTPTAAMNGKTNGSTTANGNTNLGSNNPVLTDNV